MKKKILAFLSIIFFGASTQLMSCPHEGTWHICDTSDIEMIWQLIYAHPDCEEGVVYNVYFVPLPPEVCPPI
jgi:hypothetical protein